MSVEKKDVLPVLSMTIETRTGKRDWAVTAITGTPYTTICEITDEDGDLDVTTTRLVIQAAKRIIAEAELSVAIHDRICGETS
ncbi:hypothetical protein OZX67_03910 [Bifidobacterium sp. ESL0728]|uniref:hypothetical protein n=1 Tax=Bifidobacterium sp. ESL0728 TaxID=2983220 RepID=UPI0023F8A10F|nr:hypothetical protein [Bifidobacterium sp. ESL0728]WEV59693.1 hypothetical protein OZX67_03910 [Bifidobacterium sp. ESL0728]